MEIQLGIRAFIQNRRARNLSENTIVWYQNCFKRMEQYCDESMIFELEDLTTEDIEKILVFKMGNKELSSESKFDYWTALKIFFEYLMEAGHIKINPMAKLRPPKRAKKIRRTFTPEEVKKIFNSFNKSEFVGMRDFAIVCTLLSTGIRRDELKNLKVEDLNFELESILVTGKGNKQRIVPMSPTLKRVLARYILVRTKKIGQWKCDYLFISAVTLNRISNSGINNIMIRIRETCGIQGEKLNAHCWRHTFALNYLINGGDVFSLQKILGHEQVETTKIYVNMNTSNIRHLHKRYNPLDNQEWMLDES